MQAERATDQRSLELALRRSEQRFRALVAASSDGVLEIGSDGRIGFADHRAAELHGYATAGELVGLPWTALIAPEYREQAMSRRLQPEESGKLVAIEYLALRRDGSSFLAQVTGAPADGAVDALPALTVIVRDGSEPERLKQQLSEERERLTTFQEDRVAARTAEIAGLQEVTAALSGAATVSEVAQVVIARVIPLMGASGGSVHVLSEDGTRLEYIGGSGYAPEVLEALQQVPLAVPRPLAEAVRERSVLWIESLDQWRRRYPEDPVAHGEGGQAAAVIPLVAQENPIGVLNITFRVSREFDDDERRFLLSVSQQCAQALERARLYDAERRRAVELQSLNHELESFAYSVSHDLRSPLRGIDGFSKLVLERHSDQLDDTGKQYLNRVRAATGRMSLLIDDLLKLSRVTRSELNRQPLDLSEMAREVLRDLTVAEPERNVDSHIQAGLVTRGDPQLLRVVLENLLGNAWKFTSTRDLARIEVGSREQDGEVAYFVRDNGVGFDMAYAHKLFGPFQRLHSMNEFPGTGIGLATVQRIVNRHSGRTWAEAVIEHGATMSFSVGVE